MLPSGGDTKHSGRLAAAEERKNQRALNAGSYCQSQPRPDYGLPSFSIDNHRRGSGIAKIASRKKGFQTGGRKGVTVANQ